MFGRHCRRQDAGIFQSGESGLAYGCANGAHAGIGGYRLRPLLSLFKLGVWWYVML